MKTEIYKSLSAFLARPDKSVNGVSPAFAEANPGYTEERGNTGCWNCSDCLRCSDCSDCSGCSGCSRCSRCSRCSDCSDKFGENPLPEIPVIDEIHRKIFAAASTPCALDMSAWHTCETTHCRAGWVVTLAGEAGKKLEQATSTLFAAMQIYKVSSPLPVSPVRFYESNEKALADMQKCAEEEAAAVTP